MGLIYSKAIRVWAWVGLGSERHLSAFKHIAEIDWPAEIQRLEDEQESSIIEQHVESINILLSLKYWTRLWIFQEYILARCVTIQCSPKVLSGTTLDHLANAVGGLRASMSNYSEKGLLLGQDFAFFN